MIDVHTSMQPARKWRQIEDNFTGDIIGYGGPNSWKWNKQWVMESISFAPEMTEIYVDSLPGIRCVYLDVILPVSGQLGPKPTRPNTILAQN